MTTKMNMSNKKALKIDLDYSSSDNEQNAEPLKINEKFAASYDSWRRKEEIARLKGKYGDADDLDKAWTSDEDEGNRIHESSDESDSESSTDLDEKLAREEVFDKQFFKCYSALKKKDQKIYDNNFKFFEEEPSSLSSEDTEGDGNSTVDSNKANKKISVPKMTLLDYHIKLATGLEADTPEHQMSSNLVLKPQDKSYYERELDDIKNELKEASKGLDDRSSDDNDDLFIKKNQKSEEDIDANVKLKAQKKDVISQEISKDEDLSYLKDFWHKDNQKLDEREKFLRDFILNRIYLSEARDSDSETDDADNSTEFFSKATNDTPEGFKSEEDDDIEKNNPVEKTQKAKFHSDEINSGQIQRIPRNVTTTIRDLERQQSRKEKRESKRERKKKEKVDELNRLRLFKKQEMEEKLEKLRKISGDPNLTLEDAEFAEILDEDQDFNPKKYDEKMRNIFNDELYYKGQDEDKPKFDYEPQIDDNLYEDSDEGNEGEKDDGDDNDADAAAAAAAAADDDDDDDADDDDDDDGDDGDDDADDDGDDDGDGDDETQELDGRPKRKRHKRQRVNKAKRTKKMKAALYEDIIAGIPTRFKYRRTVPNDFGLNNYELLMATDQELNRWVSLKKTSQYRSEEQEIFDCKVYSKQRNNMKLKQKIFKSIYGIKEGEITVEHKVMSDDGKTSEVQCVQKEKGSAKNMKKKHKRGTNHKKTKCGIPEERLLAYGMSKKKLKKSKLL